MVIFNKIKELSHFFDDTEGIVKTLLWLSMVVSFYFNLNSIIAFSEQFTKLPSMFAVPIGCLVTFLLVKGINTIAKDFISEFGKFTVRFYTLSALLILLAVFLLTNSYNGGAVLAENKVKFTPLSEASAEAIKSQINEETQKYNLLISKEDSLLNTLKNNWLTAKQREQILQNKATYIKEKSQRLTALEAQYANEIAYIRAENDRREKQFKSQLQKANEQGGATGGVSELAVFILTAILIGLGVREKQNASPTPIANEPNQPANSQANPQTVASAKIPINHNVNFINLSNTEFRKIYAPLFEDFNANTPCYKIAMKFSPSEHTLEKIKKNWKERGLDDENMQFHYDSGKLNGVTWTNPNPNYHHDTT